MKRETKKAVRVKKVEVKKMTTLKAQKEESGGLKVGDVVETQDGAGKIIEIGERYVKIDLKNGAKAMVEIARLLSKVKK